MAGRAVEAQWGRALHTYSLSRVFLPRTVGRKPPKDVKKGDRIRFLIVKITDKLVVPPPLDFGVSR